MNEANPFEPDIDRLVREMEALALALKDGDYDEACFRAVLVVNHAAVHGLTGVRRTAEYLALALDPLRTPSPSFQATFLVELSEQLELFIREQIDRTRRS